MYVREDQADIRVSVDGQALGDSWATAEGGNLEADDAKARPGGMGREVSIGGPGQRDDLEVAIHFTDLTMQWVGWLENKVGIGRVRVGLIWLNPNRTPTGVTRTVQGTVKGVETPDHDSTSSDPGFLTLTVACDELAA